MSSIKLLKLKRQVLISPTIMTTQFFILPPALVIFMDTRIIFIVKEKQKSIK